MKKGQIWGEFLG